MRKRSILYRLWGAYYVVTGLWPVLHMRSFEAVTGPKVDDWLVHMVGLLAAAIGATLIVASSKRRASDPAFLAIASALAFTAIDLWYVAARVISPIYLGDAVVELLLVGLLLATKADGPPGTVDRLTDRR
jgi:hypothetical protein